MTRHEERTLVVATAHAWLRTPWHHEARILGAGVDCAQLLVACYCDTGIVPHPMIDHYPPDWHLHRDRPRFMEHLLRYCLPVNTPEPGDVVMFQYGRHAAHGGIHIGAGTLIHAWRDEGRVVLSDITRGPLAERLAGVYRLRRWALPEEIEA